MLQFMESCHFSQQSKSHPEKAATKTEQSSSIVQSEAESEKDIAASSDFLSEALQDVSYLLLLLSHHITLQYSVLKSFRQFMDFQSELQEPSGTPYFMETDYPWSAAASPMSS